MEELGYRLFIKEYQGLDWVKLEYHSQMTQQGI